MNKYDIHLMQKLILIGLVLLFSTLFIGCGSISQGNKMEDKVNVSQGQDTITTQGNSSNLSSNIKQDTLTATESDSPIIPNASAKSDISAIETYDIKEAIDNEQVNAYTIHHDKDNSTYTIIVICDERYHYTIQLYDVKSSFLQTFELGSGPGVIEFQDVNMDGYTDIVVNTGGTFNETHDLYIWDTSSEGFIKVIYEGFDMLAWFTVREGYIENFIRGDTPDDSVMQKLIWNGNILTIELEDN